MECWRLLNVGPYLCCSNRVGRTRHTACLLTKSREASDDGKAKFDRRRYMLPSPVNSGIRPLSALTKFGPEYTDNCCWNPCGAHPVHFKWCQTHIGSKLTSSTLFHIQWGRDGHKGGCGDRPPPPPGEYHWSKASQYWTKCPVFIHISPAPPPETRPWARPCHAVLKREMNCQISCTV